jgi:murein tripeptide amidase MpaA
MNYQTHNGRDLYWVRISNDPTVDQDKPEVLYTGMHHAREPIGMQLLIYYMYYLLENYDTDPEVQYIVNNFELYFVPILNMDGYAYNIQNQPNGGGEWRKNRRQNDDGSYGVDINRNYDYMWGYDNDGSSPYPWDDTYRGPSAFSEPEIMNARFVMTTSSV